MVKYQMEVQNDNGNSQHKIIVDGTLLKHPNVYTVLHSIPGETDGDLQTAVVNLHKNIDVRIESKAIGGDSRRYLIGDAALESVVGSDLYNMDVTNVQKHKEKLPIVNTLGIIAVMAVKKHFQQIGSLTDAETIEVQVDMITALPASIHTVKTEKEFSEKFLNGVHEVKVYVKNLTINVQIRFESVQTLREGVPAMFAIIEDGKGNYRNDDLFKRFKEEYKLEKVDGSYLLEKRILHCDIGDGSTELIFTQGYAADPLKSSGEKFGLGQAIEKAAVNMSEEEGMEITRQQYSKFLKGEGKQRLVKAAKEHLNAAKSEVVERLYDVITKKAKVLKYEFDVLVVYGGASILLEDSLYPKFKDFCDKNEMELLWAPPEFATEMNVQGMQIYQEIMKEQADEEIAASEDSEE
ncbi:ParM/StbA family protein [Bacillus sp. OTU530]|uniref:ParM/StbA family protein n=1 Tax=Bacillus sp. OTU530 TaxID=3043862 RepID=UPI00313CB1B2